MLVGLRNEAAVRRLLLKRPRRLARPRTPPFHGDNTGSNPVGDANQHAAFVAFHFIRFIFGTSTGLTFGKNGHHAISVGKR